MPLAFRSFKVTAWGGGAGELTQLLSHPPFLPLSPSSLHKDALLLGEPSLQWFAWAVGLGVGRGGVRRPPFLPVKLLIPLSAWEGCWQHFLFLNFLSLSACPHLTLRVPLETQQKGQPQRGVPAPARKYRESRAPAQCLYFLWSPTVQTLSVASLSPWAWK